MKGLLLGLWAALSMTSAVAEGDWKFIGHGSTDDLAGCDFQVQGTVLNEAGADVQLECDAADSVVGNVQFELPARALRQRRVMLVAEFKTDADMSASLWLKATNNHQTLMLEDDVEQAMFGNDELADGWQSRLLTLPVDISASQLRFGVLLQGRGKLALRNVRLVVSEPGAISAAAAAYLDDALALLKQQTQGRSDMRWMMLEPQMRVLASGAQTTDEVYPAIRYALAKMDTVNQRRNLLLTPQIARALHAATGQSNASRMLSLSDGAQLVLAAMPLRTAKNTLANVNEPALP